MKVKLHFGHADHIVNVRAIERRGVYRSDDASTARAMVARAKEHAATMLLHVETANGGFDVVTVPAHTIDEVSE